MIELRGSRIIVAGGTGLVGIRLVEELLKQGAAVQVITRNPRRARLPEGAQACSWEDLPRLVDGSSAIINLAGEAIADRRWSPVRKQALHESRIAPTRSLVSALAQANHGPSVLINASAIGIYGTRGEESVNEDQAPGVGFLPELCRAWEATADSARALGIRVVLLRTGVVLAREGGALPKLALPLRCFAGTVLGSGRQGFSWIHIEDLVQLVLESIGNPAFAGPLNATAPHPCSQGAFTRLLAKRLHRPLWPVPGFISGAMLKLLLGEMAEPMLLGGAFVLPKKSLDLGFHFRFPQAADALQDLL